MNDIHENSGLLYKYSTCKYVHVHTVHVVPTQQWTICTTVREVNQVSTRIGSHITSDSRMTEHVTSLDVNAVVVVGAERVVALGALALSRLVTRLETLEAEDVEALGQDGVLLLDLA